MWKSSCSISKIRILEYEPLNCHSSICVCAAARAKSHNDYNIYKYKEYIYICQCIMLFDLPASVPTHTHQREENCSSFRKALRRRAAIGVLLSNGHRFIYYDPDVYTIPVVVEMLTLICPFSFRIGEE